MIPTHILNKLIARENLTTAETDIFIDLLLSEDSSPIQSGALLTALRSKGETTKEIIGCITGMRKRMITINAPQAIDVCGTGGDGSDTFNISTAVSFVVAGAGVPVVKHGNRAATSKCGSADVLEALGVNIVLSAQQAEHVYRRAGIVFLFAPLFHPSFKQVSNVRKALGIPTIFNYLGPFLNPASVKRQLIGVVNKEIALKLAKAAAKLSYEHVCIVSSKDGLDEVSLEGETDMFEVKRAEVSSFTIRPDAFNIPTAGKALLRGGNAVENADILVRILQGEKGPKRDAVVLNSAVALYISGKAATIAEGVQLAQQSIDTGLAYSALEKLRKETKQYA